MILLSRNETVAVETLPATQSLSVSTGMEHAHKCMNDGVNDGASERFGPRVDGSFCSMKVSNPPLETEALSGADAAASEIGYSTYSTQPPPRSGYGSCGRERVAILGLDESSVASSTERQQSGHEARASVDVRCNEARGARQQKQEEQPDVVVTGNTVPCVVPSGVRSSDSQLSSVNVRMDESTQVASMEHDDDGSWNCRPENLLLSERGNERIVGRIELSSAAYGGARTSTSSSTLGSSTAWQQQQQQQPSQSFSSSSYDSELVVRSQFDNLSVCTRVDGKNDFLRCNDDDGKTERTFSRQIAARIGGHPPVGHTVTHHLYVGRLQIVRT